MIQFNSNEFAPFYETYVSKSILTLDIVNGLETQEIVVACFFKEIPLDKQEFQYAEGKWTPKDILLHLIDAERIFVYRALRISRNDTTALAGFEENDYVPNAKANDRTMESLLQEYQTVRKATVSLFQNLTQEQLVRVGVASNNSISVRAIGYIIMGHENHHVAIIKERYL